jgi:hypothetical protein
MDTGVLYVFCNLHYRIREVRDYLEVSAVFEIYKE